jgi:hypothetical protein
MLRSSEDGQVAVIDEGVDTVVDSTSIRAFRKLEAKGYISIERNARGGVRATQRPPIAESVPRRGDP